MNALCKTALCCGVALSLVACAAPRSHVSSDASGVPEPLRVPADQVLTLAAHGTGVQIYACETAKDAAGTYGWILTAPEADLAYMHSGKKFGKHGAGPSWEASDGSRVIGELVTRDDSPDAAAIPWLLLRAKSTSGKGLFSNVRSIQRLHTVGGKAPAGGCDASHAGAQIRVAYSADYYFYASKG